MSKEYPDNSIEKKIRATADKYNPIYVNVINGDTTQLFRELVKSEYQQSQPIVQRPRSKSS